MKVALTVVLTICLICSTVALFRDRETGPPKDVWGRPSNGIQAIIYATRPIAKVGQRCDIHIRLRNPGKDRLVLHSSTYVTNSTWLNGRIYGQEIGDMKLCEEPSIVLEQGQVKDLLYCTHYSKQTGVHGYLAQLSLSGGVRSNKITMYVIPGNGFWIVLIALELAGLYLALRRKNRSATNARPEALPTSGEDNKET